MNGRAKFVSRRSQTACPYKIASAMRVLPNRAAAKLIELARRYHKQTFPHFRAVGSWRRLSNNELWIRTVYQVAVVGSSASMERLRQSASAQRGLHLDHLSRLTPRERARAVHRALRSNGVRYVPRQLSKCRKTKAVLENFAFIASVPGSATGYFRRLAAERDDDERARQLAKDLHYIKLKGSRDLMADFGLARNVIALDVRLLNVLKRVGARIPVDVQTNERSYRMVQAALLTQVAKPAGLTGVELDRVLFNNYVAILNDL